jgi:enolase
MGQVKQILSRQILDSRGMPTVETLLVLDSGGYVTSSVPSGASTGTHEALELRDNDPNKYLGLGVLKAVHNVAEVIAPKIVGMDPTKQAEIDLAMIALDGSKNKSHLGANAMLSVSMAVCKAGALVSGVPLYSYINSLGKFATPTRVPTPMFNLVNGGLHGTGNLDFQEFHLIPASNKPFSEALKIGVETYQHLKIVLSRRGAIHSVGDEGGFTPNLFTNMDVFEVLLEAVREAEYIPGQDIFLGLDVAANTFYKDGKYTIRDRGSPLSGAEMIDFYRNLLEQYRLISIEDGLHEEDWAGWARLTLELGGKTMIVGDDLLVTNKDRLQKAIDMKAANTILIKPNQIGTVSETIDTIQLARRAGWQTIISHRSGETNDTFIADFSVGVVDAYCKFGAPARGERVAKYNRLSTIAEELGVS